MKWIQNAKVFVTGAAGSVGREIVDQLILGQASDIVAFDHNENDLFLFSEAHRGDRRVHSVLGDVRDLDQLISASRDMDYVIHAAALKHVPLTEISPMNAVQTNVMGTQNVIEACRRNSVKKCVFTSTDKAVNPTNVMGATKLMAEKLITAAHAGRRVNGGPIFCSTRFGNVAGSKGSVIPLFASQIESQGRVTLTSVEMSRFVMTLPKAVNLVLESMAISRGGEVFITKMESLRILDLATVMIEVLAPLFGRDPKETAIDIIGPRPGEKDYEELTTDEEVRRTSEIRDFFVTLPHYWDLYQGNENYYMELGAKPIRSTYQSRMLTPLDKEQIKRFLMSESVLPEKLRSEIGRKYV